MFDLTARTEAGASLVRLAETLAEELDSRAGVHDRDRSFPYASVGALKRAGVFTAPIPVAHGGLGVTSIHDLVVASSRLARGDASVAIGVNMHLILLASVVRRWQIAEASGDERRARAFGGSLAAIARDGVTMATAISELGQDLTLPQTTASRTDAGWRSTAARPSARCPPPPRCSTPPSRTPTTTAVSVTATPRSRPTRPASRSTATGTRPACVPRAATRSASRASSCRARPCAAASMRATRPPRRQRNVGRDARGAHLIVSTFTAVSLQPPLVSFCAARDSFTWRRMRTAGRFAVNVLGARRADFARHVAARGVDRFTGAEFERGESGLPVLVDALAVFECGIEAEHLAGDHSIVVGHVDALRVPGPRLPLVYWAGAFGDFSVRSSARSPDLAAVRREPSSRDGLPCSGAYPAPTK
jgi:flavin reductase (DIM6/NTAB) family NADH-FMN oxidoreductase RutF